eukprot:SAG31_NODE_14933_length_779_cov_1.841176_1_plen_70_part_01
MAEELIVPVRQSDAEGHKSDALCPRLGFLGEKRTIAMLIIPSITMCTTLGMSMLNYDYDGTPHEYRTYAV